MIPPRWIDEWAKMLSPSKLNKIRRYPVEIINFLASILAIISFIITAFKARDPEFWYVYILLLYLFILVVAIFIQSYMHARKSRYSEAIKLLHPIAHIFRDAFYVLDNMDQKEFELIIEKILDALSMMFEIVTGTKVRVCLKRLKVEGGLQKLMTVDDSKKCDLIYAETFVANSASVRPKKQDTEYPDDKNRLSRNTAFKKILKGEMNFYIENDIPYARKKGKYESSSFARYGDGKSGRPHWVLPYRSTIVWPIRKLTEKDDIAPHRELLSQEHDLYGFLCVDSESRNVWEYRFDPEIGAAVADLLYAFIDSWCLKHCPDNHPADSGYVGP